MTAVMIHVFDVDIAEKYGLNSAILLNHFGFWIKKNEANRKHYHEGRYWTYNSMKAFKELFPYMSDWQIRSAIAKLKEEKIIICGNFNAQKYDRTAWYALTDYGLSICEIHKMEKMNSSDGKDADNEPIPVEYQQSPSSNPSSNTPIAPYEDEPTTSPLLSIPPVTPDGVTSPKGNGDEKFERFWKAYPRKAAKQNALRAWKKIRMTAEMFDKIMAAVESQKRSEDWKRDNGSYIPYPATWLNGGYWDNELKHEDDGKHYLN